MSELDSWEDLEDVPPKKTRAFITKIAAQLEGWSLVAVVAGVLRGTLKVTVEIVRQLSDPTRVILQATEKPKQLLDRGDVYLHPNAAKLFGSEHTSRAVSERTLEYRRIDTVANDFAIIEELGGEEDSASASVKMLDADIGQLIDAGKLLKDGRANVFYLRDPELHLLLY